MDSFSAPFCLSIRRHEHGRHDGRHEDGRLNSLDRLLGRLARQLAAGQLLQPFFALLQFLFGNTLSSIPADLGQGDDDDRPRPPAGWSR